MFKKILVANRGEIAVRVLRTCRAMGLPTVAVYSEADRAARHVRLADEAAHIGPSPAAASYLSIERILDAARRTGTDAIHPGYGFLSENSAFADACGAAGIKFIGPSAAAMALMGSKTRSRQIMQKAGIPVVPGTAEPLESPEDAERVADDVGFPVMLKASGGGGGKGMRLVHSPEDLASAYEQASAEAAGAFGNPDLYIEKAILAPRHIEVQILADEHGRVIHLGERECSIQRRHQKVLEECPSPFLAGHAEVREKLTATAVQAARAAGYTNAGTVELLMDADRNFYFLEMNTRLQVEHPVTEMVTGLDLVKEQIRIAAGETLPYRQEDIPWRGSAIECRVYAEDPSNSFFPSPGRIVALDEPSGPGVRVDSAAYAGWDVPIEYDPLLAKLIVWAPTRPEAIERLRAALGEYHIAGIRTTLPFFREIVHDAEFRRGEVDTHFIERRSGRDAPPTPVDGEEPVALLTAAVHFLNHGSGQEGRPRVQPSVWKSVGRRSLLR